jgi:hypothetical protein
VGRGCSERHDEQVSVWWHDKALAAAADAASAAPLLAGWAVLLLALLAAAPGWARTGEACSHTRQVNVIPGLSLIAHNRMPH